MDRQMDMVGPAAPTSGYIPLLLSAAPFQEPSPSPQQLPPLGLGPALGGLHGTASSPAL